MDDYGAVIGMKKKQRELETIILKLANNEPLTEKENNIVESLKAKRVLTS